MNNRRVKVNDFEIEYKPMTAAMLMDIMSTQGEAGLITAYWNRIERITQEGIELTDDDIDDAQVFTIVRGLMEGLARAGERTAIGAAYDQQVELPARIRR